MFKIKGLLIILSILYLISLVSCDTCRCGDTLIPAKKCCKNYSGGKYTSDGKCHIPINIDWTKWNSCCKKNGDGYGGWCTYP
jgi:hypothetical protein